MFLSRGDRDLGVAFQTHPGRQAFISSGSKEPRSALEWRRSLGWASSGYIDEHGLTAALTFAARQAVAGIDATEAATILLDGNSNYLGDPRVQTVIGGDAIEPAI